MRRSAVFFLLIASLDAQTPVNMTLAQAEQLALKAHPRIASGAFLAEAASKEVSEARSAYYPTASVNITAAAANDQTTLGAGNSADIQPEQPLCFGRQYRSACHRFWADK